MAIIRLTKESEITRPQQPEPTGLHPLPRLPLPTLKPILCGPQVCQDVAVASSKEWVITNGVGGYASSTILGMNTRRYHGLLVEASHPPVGRMVMLSKVEETIVTPGGRFELSTNRYSSVIHPEGYRYLAEFRLDPWPSFLYKVGDILLEKTVFLLPGENAVVVGYTLRESPGPIELVIHPLIAVRDFRWVSRENESFNSNVEITPGQIRLNPYENLPGLTIHHTAEIAEASPSWYKNFEYSEGEEAGAEVQEDLWTPGKLLYLLKVDESCSLVASTGRRGSADLIFHQRRAENTQTVLAQTMIPPGKGALSARLSWTGDNFLARGNSGGTFLLAGFPWLTSWGRDALIALPGLFLTTRRFDAARSVLETLASQVKDGLILARLAEEDGSPEYDSADTSLWFFWAVWHYWKFTRNISFISKKLMNPMREMIQGYLEGTSFGIRMDEDGLITLADEQLPLTWMDAREPAAGLSDRQAGEADPGGRGGVPGRAVTPRFGKPVEINALWYCALSIMAELSSRLGSRRASTYLRLSRLVGKNFQSVFANPQGVLYDRVTETAFDASIRPNGLIAASLPFSPIPKAQAAQIVGLVERRLLTPMGIRTLDPAHPQYRGRYAGDLRARAEAYHQGTVWTWLIGPYVSTMLKVRRLRFAQAMLKKQLEPFLKHLEEGCLGSVTEIFDGDSPHPARGSPSQAWSVGEILRAIHEAKLTFL